MSASIPLLRDDDSVTSHLKQAWSFLSGQDRAFQFLAPGADIAFSGTGYFLPIAIEDSHDRCAVALLISPADVLAIASNMFGVPQETLSEDDLTDAGKEVCNVLSGSSLTQFAHKVQLRLGIPVEVDSVQFGRIVQGSKLDSAYRGDGGGESVYVLFFNPLALGVLAEPAPGR